MPFKKIDAAEKKKEFLNKHPEEKHIMQVLERRYEICKNLVDYRKEHKINLGDIAEHTGLSVQDLRNIEIGNDKNILDYLIYARELGLGLYLRPWEE